MTPADRPPTGHALTRRGFLALGATFGLAACSSGGSTAAPTKIGPTSPPVAKAEAARRPVNAVVRPVDLTAQAGDLDLGGVQVRTWSFGQLPGKEIRVKRGEVLRARLSNRLPQPTTIHWHGLALRNDMDGVPDLTQPAVAAGSDFTY